LKDGRRRPNQREHNAQPHRLQPQCAAGATLLPSSNQEKVMATVDKQEHRETEKALDTLASWGKNPGALGGENINFSVSRQGAPSDAFLAFGDCSHFAPSGRRGTLLGAAPNFTGAPAVYIDNFGGATPVLNQLPVTFSFDLNKGVVTLIGAFPGLPGNLQFSVEYLKTFDGAGGKNILFYSERMSDNAGYILAMQLVGAS